MPIGVPRVGYRFRGDEEDCQWVDLYNSLYNQSVLFLASDLDDELANQLVGLMTYLTMKNEKKDMFLYINSLGGAIISGFSVYDRMKSIPNRIITCCLGTAASMASFILCSGEYGFRLALPHSRVMIHQPAGGTRGQGLTIRFDSHEVEKLRTKMTILYCQVTGKHFFEIQEDMKRDKFMRAREATEYGIIDLQVGELKEVTELQAISDKKEFPREEPQYNFANLQISDGSRELQKAGKL